MRPIWATALCLALAACSARTPVVGDSPSQTLPPSPTTSSAKPRVVPAATKAVLVDGDALFVYDVKTDRVTEIARGDNIRQPKFVGETVISFVQGDAPAYLRTMDLRSRKVSDVFSVDTGIAVYGWSPARDVVGYVTVDERAYPHVHLRTVTGGGATLTATTLARALGREFEPNDQTRVEFSPDGELVLIVYTPADGDGGDSSDDESQLQVRALDGSLVHASPMRRDPTMGMWAPNGRRLYYRTGGGALYWERSSGKTSGFFSRPAWFNPSISRDGRTIVYDTRGPHPQSRIRLMDVRSGKTQTIFERGRFNAVVASDRVIWAQSGRACEGCPTGFEAGDEVFAWDLRAKKERKLAIQSLIGADVFYE